MAAGRGDADVHHQHVRAETAGKGVDGAAAFGKIDGLCRGDAGIGRGDRLGRDAVVGAEYHHLLAADRRGRGTAYPGQADHGPFELSQTARQLGAGVPAAPGLDLRFRVQGMDPLRRFFYGQRHHRRLLLSDLQYNIHVRREQGKPRKTLVI